MGEDVRRCVGVRTRLGGGQLVQGAMNLRGGGSRRESATVRNQEVGALARLCSCDDD